PGVLPALLVLFRELPRPILLRAKLGRELGAEVLGLEDLAQLDLAFLAGKGARAALEPVHGFLSGLHLPDPEARDKLLRLGEGTVHHRALVVARELHARALGA